VKYLLSYIFLAQTSLIIPPMVEAICSILGVYLCEVYYV